MATIMLNLSDPNMRNFLKAMMVLVMNDFCGIYQSIA